MSELDDMLAEARDPDRRRERMRRWEMNPNFAGCCMEAPCACGGWEALVAEAMASPAVMINVRTGEVREL